MNAIRALAPWDSMPTGWLLSQEPHHCAECGRAVRPWRLLRQFDGQPWRCERCFELLLAGQQRRSREARNALQRKLRAEMSPEQRDQARAAARVYKTTWRAKQRAQKETER